MSRLAYLLGLVVVAVLVSGAACNGKGKSPGDGGGGAAGSDGGAPITSCPAHAPSGQPACTGGFTCQYSEGCSCNGYLLYGCANGFFSITRHEYCLLQCADGGAGSGGSSVAGSGGAGGLGGTGGTGATGGAGGTGGAAGAAPITSCPAAGSVAVPTACSGEFSCLYNQPFCRCGGYLLYSCWNGSFTLSRHDTCLPDDLCADGGAGSGGSSVSGSGGAGGRGGAGGNASTTAVCTFGADQTCNDDPRLSSIRGRCTEAGACACGDAGTNPDSGRCL